MYDPETMARAYSALERLYLRFPILKEQAERHSQDELDRLALRALNDEGEMVPSAVTPEKVRNHPHYPRLRLPLIAGLVLLLLSCDTSHAASLDHAANLGHNAAVLFNSGTGRGNPNQEGVHRCESGFFVPVKRHTSAFSMAGRGGEPSGCRFLLAGFPHPAMCLPPQQWKVGGGFKPKKEATMPSIARVLSRLFTAAYPVAHFPTEPEAVLFAGQYLAQAGRAVAVTPVALGFDVIGGAA